MRKVALLLISGTSSEFFWETEENHEIASMISGLQADF
jgi:hypothetical protein